MAGQICPIFERESEDKIDLIGAWMQFPQNLKIVPDRINFMEVGHIAPMLSAFIKNEQTKEVINSSIEVGHGCKFISGAFIMGVKHPAPNEKGGKPNIDFDYVMKRNGGVTILVREKKSQTDTRFGYQKSDNTASPKKWWQFWK